MPELPEVETVARELAPLVVGQRVRACHFLDPFFGSLDPKRFVGLKITAVTRVGKQVVIALARADSTVGRHGQDYQTTVATYVAIHLRMTGRLLWHTEAEIAASAAAGVDQLPKDIQVRDTQRSGDKHVRAKWVLERGEINFHDVRRFGTIKISDRLVDFNPPGIDPTTSALTPDWLAKKFSKRTIDIKSALLNQQIICGIGNIYASEILYAAGISPFRSSSSLTKTEVAEVCLQTRRILKKAIKHCGTTFSDFQRAKGLTGSYQQYLNVYAQAGKPCTHCEEPIIKVKQSGRSTFYCPTCQV